MVERWTGRSPKNWQQCEQCDILYCPKSEWYARPLISANVTFLCCIWLFCVCGCVCGCAGVVCVWFRRYYKLCTRRLHESIHLLVMAWYGRTAANAYIHKHLQCGSGGSLNSPTALTFLFLHFR